MGFNRVISVRRFNQPGMLAAMTFGNCGYSFPAAMGAKVAAPDRYISPLSFGDYFYYHYYYYYLFPTSC